MSANRTSRCHPLFHRVRKFTRNYVVLSDHALDVVTVWIIGTHTFSPSAPAMPATYPYLYIAGPKGSGKTVLGSDVFGAVCRNHETIAGMTGPTLFRIIGEWDTETGEITCNYPTLSLDEIDATFAGVKDEANRLVANVGYKMGATIPRSHGKLSIRFPVYCPKALMGIDNGHLPETILDRAIRIDMRKATREERSTIEPFYSWDTEEEGQSIREAARAWACEHAMVLRDYRPPEVEGMSPRQWEISRSLVQLASALGCEDRIRQALHKLMVEGEVKPDRKVSLYQSIYDLFSDTGEERVTTRMILDKLDEDGVAVHGHGMKGKGKALKNLLAEDGIDAPGVIRLPEGHPGILIDEETGKPKYVQKGYTLSAFDQAFDRYLTDEDYL